MPHTCYLKLSPKECWALLSAIVDCEPELFKKIQMIAKIYTDNPEQYELECEALDIFSKVMSAYCEVAQIEHKEGLVYIHWHHFNRGSGYSIYDVATKTIKTDEN